MRRREAQVPRLAIGLAMVVAMASGARAQAPPSAGPAAGPAEGARPAQTQADDYTSYELLDPERQQFRILYDVTATTAGATHFFNPIRPGSVATDERVTDLATGAPLAFDVVAGRVARAGGVASARDDGEYIRVALASPVPANGERRIRIDKTYRDPASYTREGTTIRFRRLLGIRRNKIVLPAGYELEACNVPSQVFLEADGRVALSFVNSFPGPADLAIEARPFRAGAQPATAGAAPGGAASTPGLAAPTPGGSATEPTLAASATQLVAERAFQDREIVYFLQQPDTHAFDLFHDYTETRPGTATYVNVVRAGSRVSNPSAIDLDTGQPLVVDTLKGEAISRAKIDIGEPATAQAEAVVVRFAAVKAGTSTRLRITETYTDPARYGLVNGGLVWRRTFGRPRNAIVLPAGWSLAASSMPATVSRAPDGRIRLDFVNGRPDALDVLIRARRAATEPAAR